MYLCYFVVFSLLCVLTVASCRHVSPRREEGKKAYSEHEEDEKENGEQQWPESEEDWKVVVDTFEKHRKLKWPVNNAEWRRLLRRLHKHGKLNDGREKGEEVMKEPNEETGEVVCWYEGSILKVGERFKGGSCVCEESGFLACP